MEDQIYQGQKKNKLKVYIPLAIVTIAVLIAAYFWYRDYSRYITTDDAYIESDNVSVGSKILGRIVKSYVDEGDSVKMGELLAELDSSDLVASMNQSFALIDQAVTTQSQAQASYASDTVNIKVLELNLEKAKDDYNRAKAQYEGNVITKENFEHLKKAYEILEAQLNVARKNLDVSKTKIASASSSIETAKSQLKMIETNLKNTKLFASMDGIIAKRWLLPGDIISPGQSLFTITKNKNYHVIIYLEETKISMIHPGQQTNFTIDAFSGYRFSGKVYNVGSNTASQFSLIPPSNASGNFTKVTQRVPVKISIDAVESGEKLSDFKILAGMSVVVKIIK